MAPCILWIDELEMALSRGGLDGGTSDRVFGTILTWMAEKTAPCFVVATANDVSRLPPELVRKGRFDEIFFLDLPTTAERKEIFALHLKQRGRQVKMSDLDQLVQASESRVGSEIEQAVIDGLVVAFHEGARKLTAEDMLEVLRRQKPLSVSQRERIQELRRWVQEGRARSASFEEAGQAQQCFLPIEFRPT